MSTILSAALEYAARGWPVFPCDAHKKPCTDHGFKDASNDERLINHWWTRLPHALIGIPTGEGTGLAVLDVDVKQGKNGLRTLARLLGADELPATPTVHTRTGGLHLHFRRPEGGFGNTVGAGGRGIGEGLDWRCDGGYVVLPAPGTGYSWDRHRNYETCSPIDVPEALLPHPAERREHPFSQHGRGSRFGAMLAINSLNGVRRFLSQTAPGERNQVLFWAACRFGDAVTAGLLHEDDARGILENAATRTGLPAREVARTISSAFGRTDR